MVSTVGIALYACIDELMVVCFSMGMCVFAYYYSYVIEVSMRVCIS